MKPQDKPSTPIHERGAGHLPAFFQETSDLRRQGIGQEFDGVNAVVHRPEFHTVPRGRQNPSGNRVFLGAPPAQGHPVKQGAGR